MKQNHYALLGISPEADTESIERAVAGALSVTDDSAQRVLLRHARDTLCSPDRRAAYDRSLRSSSAPVPAPRAPSRPPEVPESNPWRLWLGLGSLVLVAGGLGYQFAKPKAATALATEAKGTSKTQPLLVRPLNAHTGNSHRPVATGDAVAGGVANAEAVYAAAAPSVVVIESLNTSGVAASRGSGVVVGTEQVITNCHVVQYASAVRVRSGSNEHTAVPDTADTHLDLCLIRVPGLEAPTVRRGSVKQVRVGQAVFAIGTPHGLERTLSQGLVSALRETEEGTLIQTSAAISPGSSGGGLFDGEGRLIGITTFQHKLGQNLNFALPVDLLDGLRNR